MELEKKKALQALIALLKTNPPREIGTLKNADNPEKMCCLGHATDLAIREGWVNGKWVKVTRKYRKGGHCYIENDEEVPDNLLEIESGLSFLHDSVAAVYGFSPGNQGDPAMQLPTGEKFHLSELNDAKDDRGNMLYSYAEIAKFIEDNYLRAD